MEEKLLKEAYEKSKDYLYEDNSRYNLLSIIEKDRDEAHVHSKVIYSLLSQNWGKKDKETFLTLLIICIILIINIFHAADGWGYRFLADKILEADRFNPSLAARLAHAFNICRRLEPVRRNLMAEQLRRINGTEGLSGETGEIVGKILQAV